MTLIEAIDNARALLNEQLDPTRVFPDDTSSFFTDTTLMRFHNLVQAEIAAEIVETYEDYFLTSTYIDVVSGQTDYGLPADFSKIRRLEDVRQNPPREIYPIGLNEKDERTLPFDVSGTSEQRYYLKGTTVAFDNTPAFTTSGAYRMYYIKALADVTAGSDSSQIPAQHHRVIVWGIVKYGLIQQQSSPESLNMATVEYERGLNKMKQQVETRQLQRPRQVRKEKWIT